MRLAKFALMRPREHVHRRALSGEDDVDADGAGLLRQDGERRLDLALHRHHQVGQLVHDHHDERKRSLPILRLRPAARVACRPAPR